jgi:hypothetical protein
MNPAPRYVAVVRLVPVARSQDGSQACGAAVPYPRELFGDTPPFKMAGLFGALSPREPGSKVEPRMGILDLVPPPDLYQSQIPGAVSNVNMEAGCRLARAQSR